MAGFWDSIQSFIPETERTKMFKAENALRMRALQREEEAAAREEENLLRRQGMANFATSPSLEAAYPEFIAQGQQRNALDRADPAAALARLQSKLNPEGFTGTVGQDQDAYVRGVKVASGPRTAPPSTAAYKEGEIKDMIVGDQLVPHQHLGGRWLPLEGKGGPRFEPERAPQKPYGYDDDQRRKDEAAAAERKKAEREGRADQLSYENTDAGFSDIMRMAARIGTNPNLEDYTGMYDGRTPNLTEGARAFASDLDVLKSNLALTALNAAKAGSATGATGFGALSEGELKILQNQIDSLDPSVGKKKFQEKVVNIIEKTKAMQSRLRTARGAPGSPAAPSAASTAGFKILGVSS